MERPNPEEEAASVGGFAFAAPHQTGVDPK
jgi:hypothetical protein